MSGFTFCRLHQLPKQRTILLLILSILLFVVHNPVDEEESPASLTAAARFLLTTWNSFACVWYSSSPLSDLTPTRRTAASRCTRNLINFTSSKEVERVKGEGEEEEVEEVEVVCCCCLREGRRAERGSSMAV